MPIQIGRYEFPSNKEGHIDQDLGLMLSRKNQHGSWFAWPSLERAKAGEDKFAHFATIVNISDGGGSVYDGAAMTVVTPQRVLGLLTKGSLSTREGAVTLTEDTGPFAGYALDLSDLASSKVGRNWRGKPSSITFRGPETDPFVVVIEDVFARVWDNRAGQRAGIDLFISMFEEASGKPIEP